MSEATKVLDLIKACDPWRQRIAVIQNHLNNVSTAPSCKATVKIFIDGYSIELNHRYAGEMARLKPGMGLLMLGTIKALREELAHCEATLASMTRQIREAAL